MRGERATATILALALVLCGSGWVSAQRAVDRHRGLWEEDHPLMFLPSGEYLKAASLGHETLLADLIYLWSIQYYARTTPEGRRYMWHIYDVITDLDPRYLDAYSTGAMIMAIQMQDVGMAMRLLEKGMENNPDAWILPFEAGFYAYQYQGDYLEAADYFDRAMRIPGAPDMVRRLRAGMYEYAGDVERALEFWVRVYEEAETERVRRIAWQHVYDLQVSLDRRTIEAAAGRFEEAEGRPPSSLQELVGAGYLGGVPRNPAGEPYRWDPDARQVVDPGGERPRSAR